MDFAKLLNLEKKKNRKFLEILDNEFIKASKNKNISKAMKRIHYRLKSVLLTK